jgi:hypothetical protein
MDKTIKVFGKMVGKVKGDTFEKIVDSRSHFLKSPPAITVDLRSLEQAETAGARQVIIIDKYTGKEYTATIKYLRAFGLELDRGYGKQIALEIPKWSVKSPGQQRLIE